MIHRLLRVLVSARYFAVFLITQIPLLNFQHFFLSDEIQSLVSHLKSYQGVSMRKHFGQASY